VVTVVLMVLLSCGQQETDTEPESSVLQVRAIGEHTNGS
jgi:hypothetical protein